MSSSTNTNSQVLTTDDCISTENVEHDASHDNASDNLVDNSESSQTNDDDGNHESYEPEMGYYGGPDCNCDGAYGYDDDGQIIHDIDCIFVGMKEDHLFNHGEGGTWYWN